MRMDDWMSSLEDISMFIAFHDDTVHPFYLRNNIYNLQHIDGPVTSRIFGLYSLELWKLFPTHDCFRKLGTGNNAPKDPRSTGRTGLFVYMFCFNVEYKSHRKTCRLISLHLP